MNIGKDSSVSTLVLKLSESLCVSPECVEMLLDTGLAALAASLRLFFRMLPVDAMRTAGRPVMVSSGGGNGTELASVSYIVSSSSHCCKLDMFVLICCFRSYDDDGRPGKPSLCMRSLVLGDAVVA